MGGPPNSCSVVMGGAEGYGCVLKVLLAPAGPTLASALDFWRTRLGACGIELGLAAAAAALLPDRARIDESLNCVVHTACWAEHLRLTTLSRLYRGIQIVGALWTEFQVQCEERVTI